MIWNRQEQNIKQTQPIKNSHLSTVWGARNTPFHYFVSGIFNFFAFSPSLHRCRSRLSFSFSAVIRIDVSNLPLTVADLALDGINFTTWLHWLHHDWVARSIAGRADMLFDLRTFQAAHLEPSVRSSADQPLGFAFSPNSTSRQIASERVDRWRFRRLIVCRSRSSLAVRRKGASIACDGSSPGSSRITS